MANMSYCRFRNTLKDLKDCERNLFDEVSDEEDEARKKLVALCADIVEQAKDFYLDEENPTL